MPRKNPPDSRSTDGLTRPAQRLLDSVQRHQEQVTTTHGKRAKQQAETLAKAGQSIAQAAADGTAWAQWQAYATDAVQRMALTLDVLRERADNDQRHEAAGTPPVLNYEHEMVVDGCTLSRPVNYQLLRILPPQGVQVFDWKRPYMIIDPRAGHGAGIGGFKVDSQVGVALRAGHPVYFVVFRQHPEPGQTLADIMRAEADFLREIARRHPRAPKAVVVGNCQGGWATLILAASNPDLTGPLVVNGAPVSTWSGQVGENPMRYNGGLLGGVLPAMLMSDLGRGEFDGAHLVSNFEMLNPGRNYFGKYYDLFADVEHRKEDFLEFERWWGGFHFTNAAEIRWIVEELFIGNRLARGEAMLEPGLPVDLKAIRAPIIVFASRGDNITPPQQALNWIVDTFVDEHEIRVRGQRILYMVHDKVGHLGIFVSSSIARKEHAEMASTLKTIEALAPGLYEMKIDEAQGEEGQEHFLVSFHDRTMADILSAVDNDRAQERDFAAVARLSELGGNLYDLGVRPFVQAMVTQEFADALREAHPSRASRKAFADTNPMVRMAQPLVQWAQAQRQKADPSNPFLALERTAAEGVIQGLDLFRDLRDAGYEAAFLSIYGWPWMHRVGADHAQQRTRRNPEELRHLPEVQKVLARLAHGDIAAAVIRMLVLLADARGSVRRDRLERSTHVLHHQEPFKAMGPERRATLIGEQSIIVEFEAERGLEALPQLLKDADSRRRAMELVRFVVGAPEEMEPDTVTMLARMAQLLGLPEEAKAVAAPRRATAPSARAAVAKAARTPAAGAKTAGAKAPASRKRSTSPRN
jgi:pimeloyl-ACP methyl ester carboxylesterase